MTEPNPPAGTPAQPPMAQPPMAQPSTLLPTPDERNWAMLSHLGAFVAAWLALGLVAPLIVMLTKGRDSEYVRRHAVESLNFQLSSLLWIAISAVLTLILVGFVLLLAYGILYLVVVIRAGVAASNGRDYRYPFTIRFVN